MALFHAHRHKQCTPNRGRPIILNVFKDSVQSYLSGKKLEYTEAVDASLIGGFTVKVDSKLLDASISNELRKLRLKLLSNK